MVLGKFLYLSHKHYHCHYVFYFYFPLYSYIPKACFSNLSYNLNLPQYCYKEGKQSYHTESLSFFTCKSRYLQPLSGMIVRVPLWFLGASSPVLAAIKDFDYAFSTTSLHQSFGWDWMRRDGNGKLLRLAQSKS